MHKEKQYYEKMVDYKNYGMVLLAASVFFYLGVALPSASNRQMEIIIMMAANILFLAGSITFFSLSKHYKKKLLETEEGQEFLNNK